MIAWIHLDDTREPVLITNALETGVAPTIHILPIPPCIEDPANLGQNPPVMVEDTTEMLIWQGTMKQIHSP